MVKNVWNQNEEEIINDEERDQKWKLSSGDGDKETSAVWSLKQWLLQYFLDQRKIRSLALLYVRRSKANV